METLNSLSGAEWFDTLREMVESNSKNEVLAFIDNLPDDLQAMKDVKRGMVVLPDAENMTEEMVDATRGLHLYYMEGGNSVSCENMRLHLRRYAPWSEKHWPTWFSEDNDHLTKAGRAIVAHALTIGAFTDPDTKSKYFVEETERRQRIWDKPQHQRVRLTFNNRLTNVKFSVTAPFIHAAPGRLEDEVNGDQQIFVLRLNRSDLPKEHRKHFKGCAAQVTMKLVKECTSVEFSDIIVNDKDTLNIWEVVPTMASRY